MRKLFTFLFAALMSAGMFAAVASQPAGNLKAIEFQVPASWEDDLTPITADDLPGFVATTYDIAKTLSVPSDIMIAFVYDFPGNDELSVFTKYGGEVIEKSTTGTFVRGAFFVLAESAHIYYPVLDEPAPTTYTLQLVADPAMGSVEVTNLLGNDIIDNGNGNYTVKENTSVTLLATPLEGYEFTGWKVGNRWCDFTDCGTALNTLDNPMTFTMTADTAFMAAFAAVTPQPDFAGEGTEASPYLIATADDWNLLATRVSEGNTYSGEYFQLTNDIAISTMVGLSDHNFNGTFDGAGNTITATLSSDAACCAPFAYTYGATIKNLHTTGTITTTGDNAGGVVGRNGTASLTLTNVSSDMTINSTKANGGLVGYTINATISGCAFTGKLLSESSRRIGGFVGWKSNTTGSYLTITDCVFDPAEVTNGNSSSKTFAAYGGGTVTITNCYYTQAVSADQGKLMHAITAGEGVTVANAGAIGILYNGVLYGGNEEAISLTLSGSDYGYIASTGVLSGDANPYTLTMADAACEIQAAPAPAAPDFVNVTPNADPQHAGVYYSTFYFGSAKYKLPAEVEAYAATRGEGVLNLTKIADAGQTIPAGTAVILKATSDNFTLTLSDEAPVTVGANDLEGTDVQKATPANCYVLAGNDGVGFYHYTAAMLNEHKAYVIYAPNSGNAPKRMPFIFDAATGIENGGLLNGANGVQKVIRDGQLIIIKDGVEYNAQGQIVK